MSTDQRSTGNLNELTDSEIHYTIRYLDPDLQAESVADRDKSLLVICTGVLGLLPPGSDAKLLRCALTPGLESGGADA
jgi:hypothetical protein